MKYQILKLKYQIKWKLLMVIGFGLLAYVPAWGGFFSGDDWFHLRVSRVESWREWWGFFSFVPGEQAISFYRPLSTQIFFWLGQQLFGLNAWPWYVVAWFTFGYSLWLVYRVSRVIGVGRDIALWVVFFYGLAVSNFTKLYFLSAFQELLMLVFVLLTVLSYLKRKFWWSVGFFVLGLMSKETAIVLPGLLVLVELVQSSKFKIQNSKLSVQKSVVSNLLLKVLRNISKLWPFWIVTAIYLYLRLGVFGLPEGDSFGWDWSLTRAGNTLMWYGLWALGAPEFLVDYVGSGLRVLPRFWTDFGWWGWWVVGGLVGVVGTVGVLTLVGILRHRLGKQIAFSFLWFVVSLLPVVFMPWHKFTLELTLAMVGGAMGLGWLLNWNKESGIRNQARLKLISILFVAVWLVYNLSMNWLTYQTHYSVNRSEIAERVYDYMMVNYPEYPEGSYFEFVSSDWDAIYSIGDLPDESLEAWGDSKQVSHAIGGSEMFRVIYNDNEIEVFYEDFSSKDRPRDKLKIRLSTNLFLL